MRTPKEKRRLRKRIRNIVILILIIVGIYFIATKEQRAIAAKEQMDFNAAQLENSIASYELFISTYPQSEYVEEAYNCLYNKVAEGNPYDLFQFYKTYPKIPHALTALIKGCQRSYEEAAAINTVMEWDSFLNIMDELLKYKSEEYLIPLENVEDTVSRRAREKMTIMEYCQKGKEQKIECIFAKETKDKKDEEMIWDFVSSQQKIAYYQRYLEVFPKGKHKKECNKLLIDMEIEEIFSSGQYGQLPPMEKENMNARSLQNGYSIIEITNDTKYELTLRYGGERESKRIILSPDKTRTIRMPNGSYKITASVSADDIGNYAGEETLDSDMYSVCYYIDYTGRPLNNNWKIRERIDLLIKEQMRDIDKIIKK